MIGLVNSASKSGGGNNLTPQQRTLLNHFDQMTESAQHFMVELAEQNARVFPRSRPKLRLVAGGAA